MVKIHYRVRVFAKSDHQWPFWIGSTLINKLLIVHFRNMWFSKNALTYYLTATLVVSNWMVVFGCVFYGSWGLGFSHDEPMRKFHPD